MKVMFQENSIRPHNGLKSIPRPKAEDSSSMTKTMEEFSFPEVSVEQNSRHQLSFPHFASSPLWFQSSTSYHKFAALSHHDQRRTSFTSVEELQLLDKNRLEEVKDEERMDMLWENFNEELHQIPKNGRSGSRVGPDWSGNSNKLDGNRHGARDFSAKAAPHRRPGLMIILKVLKTLLLIQKIRKTRKMSAYHM